MAESTLPRRLGARGRPWYDARTTGPLDGTREPARKPACSATRSSRWPATRSPATATGRRPGAAPSRKPAYDVVIVGAGGHGLATAYYLAKEHGITNVAVLEQGWLGGGNTGRNTTICRSNYLYDESAAHLRPRAQAVGRPEPGAELQRHVQPARRDDAGAQRARRAGRAAAHPRQPAERRRQRVADAGAGQGVLPAAEPRHSCAIPCWAPPCSGAAARRGTTRWPGATRAAPTRAGVDIIQNCEVTGIRREGDRVVGRRDRQGLHRGQEGRRGRGRAHQRGHGAWPACACRWRARVLQALVSEPVKPVLPVRGDVQHDPRLYQPVRQGRAGDRGRLRPVQFLQPARQLPDRRAHAGGDLRAVPDLLAHADAAPLGRHRRRHGRPLADRRQDAAAGPLRQLRLGHRRLQGDAGLGPRVRPHRGARTSRTRSTRRSRSTASRPAG